MEENNVPDMRPTFDVIRNVDDKGKEYWSSRELCNAMGYSGYWKFQNVIDKAIRVAGEKGMNIDDHFNHVVEMVAYIYPFLTSNLTRFICKVYLHLFITQNQNIITTIT